MKGKLLNQPKARNRWRDNSFQQKHFDGAKMGILVGTSKGIFSIQDSGSHLLADNPGVRDLVIIDDRMFAGTGAGIFVSDDNGEY